MTGLSLKRANPPTIAASSAKQLSAKSAATQLSAKSAASSSQESHAVLSREERNDAAEKLVEGYGVKVDQELHAEILERNKKFKGAAYSGFVNPELSPIYNDKNELIEQMHEDKKLAKNLLGKSNEL